jgi:hypothetical protein
MLNNQNNRRCPHNIVTMGEISRCKDCTIELLNSDKIQLLKQLTTERRDNDVLIMRSIGLASSLRETLNYIDRPICELVFDRIKHRFYAKMYKFFTWYYSKKRDIMKRWSSLREEILKLWRS